MVMNYLLSYFALSACKTYEIQQQNSPPLFLGAVAQSNLLVSSNKQNRPIRQIARPIYCRTQTPFFPLKKESISTCGQDSRNHHNHHRNALAP